MNLLCASWGLRRGVRIARSMPESAMVRSLPQEPWGRRSAWLERPAVNPEGAGNRPAETGSFILPEDLPGSCWAARDNLAMPGADLYLPGRFRSCVLSGCEWPAT